ncbi:SGNH/GDSL hydrolase family protein [Gordonia sp. HY002]|uniref:SGNH/GDSL hydrolase family protein n=1 Tax=Gordonia zhenghanii TaxID=2911516 RepID=UPI001EF07524|nr:SGNH/GDSL hydrolase family protein [Gordonia zhenghanii]MCF8572168.1 SGNH/GDSL hydrolase family protein [Gordonia zhenghanii]MCF8606370.1 SGNH/GDSL hydrolase family protein [Gordonia zhenghanii]
MRFKHVATTVGALAAAAVMAVGLMPGAAQATPAPLKYVNLGDSYSAGSGVLPFAPEASIGCMQSADNYAKLVARSNGYDLTDVSCGGATTEDFFSSQQSGVKPQLAALDDDVDLVTFSIGGNDDDLFAGTVINCVVAGVGSGMRGTPCEDKYAKSASKTIRETTYPNLVKAMKAVRVKAPNARVAALNYPWIAPDRNAPCNGMPISAGDGKFTHRVQAELNDAIARAAEKTGVTLVDAAAASVGHDACKAPGVRWVEPVLTTSQFVPVHPNSLGERRMADVTAKTLDLK